MRADPFQGFRGVRGDGFKIEGLNETCLTADGRQE
jgi:hypothetical protein